MKRNRQKGISVVEVLITISIIIIILIPILYKFFGSQSRTAARYTSGKLELVLPQGVKSVNSERAGEIVNFTVTQDGKKYLAYFDEDGIFKVKEYTDYGIWQIEIDFVEENSK